MHIFVIKKNSIIRAVVFLLLIGITFVYTSSITKKDRAVSTQSPMKMPIFMVESEDEVALTFDTTFGDDYTAEILKVLKENDVKATFFVMGAWAAKYPASLEMIALSGHEIASHSMSHERYPDLPAKDVLADAEAAKDYLYKACDVETNMIRLPFGAFDDDTIYTLEGDGFVPIKWSLDSKDWKMILAEQIVERIKKYAKPGDIIMFQNNAGETVKALPGVLKELEKKGLKPVMLSELIPEGEVYVDDKGVLKPRNVQE